MADNGDDVDAEYRIRDGDYIVLKRGEVYKAAQIQKKRSVSWTLSYYTACWISPRRELCYLLYSQI